MSRPIPGSAPDVTATLLPIIRAGLLTGEVARQTLKSGDKKAVLVRADLQGHVTQISRYCRVGLTAFYDDNGNHRLDKAMELSNRAAKALLTTDSSLILSAEWQSGPVEVIDPITDKPAAYSTLLLEVHTAPI